MFEVGCTADLGFVASVQRSAGIPGVRAPVHYPLLRSVLLCTVVTFGWVMSPAGWFAARRCFSQMVNCASSAGWIPLPVHPGRDSHNTSHNSEVVTDSSARMQGWN